MDVELLLKAVEHQVNFDKRTDAEVAEEILAWWSDQELGTRKSELLATIYARLSRASGGPLTSRDFTEK